MGSYYSTPALTADVELEEKNSPKPEEVKTKEDSEEKPICDEGLKEVVEEDEEVEDDIPPEMAQSIVNLDTNIDTDFKEELPKYHFWGMFIDNTSESILIDRDLARVELDSTGCTKNEITDTVNAIKKMTAEEFFYLINHTVKSESHRIKGDVCMVVPNTLKIVDHVIDVTIPHHRIFKLLLKRVIHHIKEKLEKKLEWKTQKSDYAIVTSC
tara:strand:- start:206 stop:841 length:636 start_codon:yes stop_codon:yes gene_type:complete